MSNIKFNSTTKEIEITGSEPFIESHFYKIQALLIESFGEKKVNVSRQPQVDINLKLSDETQITTREMITDSNKLNAPEASPTDKSRIYEGPSVAKAKRPPIRKYFNTLGKYIRSEDTSINRSQSTEVVGQTTEEISVSSLKEKFGLSEKQIEGIIKDAEKQGKVRRYLDGSYVWV